MQDMIKRLRYPLLIISGIFAALGVVYPENFGILAWVALIPAALVLLTLLDKVRLGSLYLYGFVFYLVYYVMGYHWFISMYPMDFAGFEPNTAIGIIALAILGISAFQAALSAIMFLMFGILGRTAIMRKLPALLPLLMGCLWVVNEWSQTIGWTGLPWSRLYLTQSFVLPMAQSASLLGGLFVSFLIVAVNLAIAGAIANREHRLSYTLLGGCLLGGNLLFGLAAIDAMNGDVFPWQIGFMITALGTVALAAVYGLWRKLRADSRLVKVFFCIGLTLCVLSSLSPVLNGYANEGAPIKAAALQGNMSSKDKWATDAGRRSFNLYADLTEQAAAEGATLVVWPETALAYHLFNVPFHSERNAPISMVYDLAERTALGKVCKDNDVQLLLWFEPERVRTGIKHEINPEWLLSAKDSEGAPLKNQLLDLGRKEVLEWLIPKVDGIVKKANVAIYRQDFNMDPLPMWEQNEPSDRIGMMENLHAQGYLAYWDALMELNPGLLMDACA